MELFKKVLLVCAFCFALILTTSSLAFAQDDGAGPCDASTSSCQTDLGPVPLEPAGLVNVVLRYSLAFGGAIALILVIWGGFRIATSNGNPSEVQKGKEIITYAIVGLLLILFSVIIVSVVGGGIIGIPQIGG